MSFVVYTKDGCPNCVSAKQLLKSKGYKFTELAVDHNPALLDDLPDGARQMPQIFYKGERIGGFAGLREWIKWKEQQ